MALCVRHAGARAYCGAEGGSLTFRVAQNNLFVAIKKSASSSSPCETSLTPLLPAAGSFQHSSFLYGSRVTSAGSLLSLPRSSTLLTLVLAGLIQVRPPTYRARN